MKVSAQQAICPEQALTHSLIMRILLTFWKKACEKALLSIIYISEMTIQWNESHLFCAQEPGQFKCCLQILEKV